MLAVKWPQWRINNWWEGRKIVFGQLWTLSKLDFEIILCRESSKIYGRRKSTQLVHVTWAKRIPSKWLEAHNWDHSDTKTLVNWKEWLLKSLALQRQHPFSLQSVSNCRSYKQGRPLQRLQSCKQDPQVTTHENTVPLPQGQRAIVHDPSLWKDELHLNNLDLPPNWVSVHHKIQREDPVCSTSTL